MTTIAITYIGHRPIYKDGACGSGVTFEQGQTLAIPEQFAVRMLKHPSVYVRATGKDAKSAPAADVPVLDEDAQREKEQHDLHDVRDTIQRMDKDSLKVFAKTNWGLNLDGRKSQDALREEVLTSFERFGVAQ
jgi:hypothetical protein